MKTLGTRRELCLLGRWGRARSVQAAGRLLGLSRRSAAQRLLKRASPLGTVAKAREVEVLRIHDTNAGGGGDVMDFDETGAGVDGDGGGAAENLEVGGCASAFKEDVGVSFSAETGSEG